MKNKIAIFGTSKKKFEKRIPLHPKMFSRLNESLKKNLYFEEGYGKEFGVTSRYLQENFAGVLPRDELFVTGDVWVLPKPDKEDYKHFSSGKVLWGWPHCVQGKEITQEAIEKNMTIVAWEAMYGGKDNCHVFYKNNELAGYAAVQHMMMLVGRNGYFGHKLKAAVLGFGASARGAITSLKSLGIDDITVYSQRLGYLINGPIQNVDYQHIKVENNSCFLSEENSYASAAQVLCEYDIIVNCVLQDPTNPINYISKNDLMDISKQIDIIDISCDKGMGFEFAITTTFDEPVIKITEFVNYYSVDHTPTLYWDSASYEISKSVIEFLHFFQSDSWMNNHILKNAIEILNGKVVNDKIIKFQSRCENYPYKYTENK